MYAMLCSANTTYWTRWKALVVVNLFRDGYTLSYVSWELCYKKRLISSFLQHPLLYNLIDHKDL